MSETEAPREVPESLSVACSRCGAVIGETCRSLNADVDLGEETHAPRKRAVKLRAAQIAADTNPLPPLDARLPDVVGTPEELMANLGEHAQNIRVGEPVSTGVLGEYVSTIFVDVPDELSVVCSTCKAKVGAECTALPSGEKMGQQTHGARKLDVQRRKNEIELTQGPAFQTIDLVDKDAQLTSLNRRLDQAMSLNDAIQTRMQQAERRAALAEQSERDMRRTEIDLRRDLADARRLLDEAPAEDSLQGRRAAFVDAAAGVAPIERFAHWRHVDGARVVVLEVIRGRFRQPDGTWGDGVKYGEVVSQEVWYRTKREFLARFRLM